VSVSGTPTVNVTVGSTVRQASYLSGSGTRTLSFRYVVQGNDVDTNGIQLGTSFNLASSAIQDVDSIDALPTFIAPNTPGVKVTAPAPRVTGFNFTNGNYKLGQQFNIVAIFNEAVTITGNPRLRLNIGGNTRYANYQSGSGSTNIIFRYTVAAGDLDTDGIVITSPLDLASGDIVNSGSVTTATSFTNPSTPLVRVDGIIPTVSSVLVNNGNYSTAQHLDITVNFTEAVTATSTSLLKLDLNIGGVTRQASYNAGSGTSAIVFRYTVTAADADADGIAILSPINVSGAASLADAYGNVADYIFTPPATPAVTVNTGVPVVTTITSPANDIYKEGESLDFILNFSEAVDVTGSPRIAITVGSTARYATYALGSGGMNLTFRYTVPSGDLDTNGIAATTVIDLDGGTIQNAALTNASLTIPSQTLTGVLVDAVAPTITNVSKPADGTYVSGQQLDFTATFSEAVYLTNSPRIAIDIGGVTRYALATSGSGSTNIVFRYTVQASDVDLDGIALSSPVDLNTGAITDAAGNNSSLTFTVPNTTGVWVNGSNPTIDLVTPPADGNYVAGVTWDFVLTMSEAATVTGNPQIAITVGSTTRYAVYDSGDGTSTLTFKYTTQSGDDDGNGIELVTPLQLAGGTIKSVATVDFSLNFTSPNTSNIRVDTTAPTIASITAPAADTYGTGEALNFTVNFSEAVDVTGVPSLELTIGSTTRLATYQSGSGSTALLFRYTVVSGEVDTDGISVVSPLLLTGGSTIKDGFTNNATLTFTPPTTTTVLVDSQNPTITSVTGPASGSYKAGLNLDFIVNFSENVLVTNVPTIPLTIGVTSVNASYVSGSGSSSLTFRYTVVSPNTDADGIASASPVSVASAAIRDANNNNAVLTFTPPNTTAVLVDTTAPSISSVTGPAAGTYLTGNSLSFTVTFTENVTKTGNPRIALTIGSNTRYATYVSGDGTSSWVFTHTVVSGDYDNNGIAVTSPLELNGGAITDAALNGSGLTFTPPNTAAVNVDAIIPEITSITPPGNAAYKNGTNLTFTVNTNKVVTVASGTPRIALTVGSSTVYATYASGSGSQSLVFNYNPATTALDLNGIQFSGTALDLNGATIRDALNNNLDLDYPVSLPSLASVHVVFPAFQHWYDLSDSSKVNFTNDGTGDAIDSLVDLMGVANITATGTARPYYQASGYGTQNSPLAKFDGSNDIMNFAANPNFSAAIFVFRTRTTNTVTNSLINQTGGPAGQRKKTELATGGDLNLTVGGDYKVDGGSFTTSGLATHAWAWAAGSDYILMVNWGSASARATTLGSTTFNGEIAEVILLDDTGSALSEAQFNEIRTFLNAKHGAY